MQILMPVEGVVWTWVIENLVDNKLTITDFFSMHRMTQQCTSVGCKWKEMHSGFLYYYGLTANSLIDVVKTCLWLAKDVADCDAFSVQTVMDNDKDTLINQCGFSTGDGRLMYYLVNWSTGDADIQAKDVGAILV